MSDLISAPKKRGRPKGSTKPKVVLEKKKKGGWKNPASIHNGSLGGSSEKVHLLDGLINLNTGKEVLQTTNPYYPSMKAAALALGIDMSVLKDARMRDCPAFRSSGNVHREMIARWLRLNAPDASTNGEAKNETPEEEFIDSYDIPDEAGGVGQTLKSLQAYERRAKRKLDELEKSNLHSAIKAEKVKSALDAWIKVVNALLKYDLSVSQAKRESGELIPIIDARKGVHALLAWHTIATSDAMRNVFPQMEGKNKFEMAALWDPAARAAIYRNFKLGCELGKIPEWMMLTANEFVKDEKPLSMKPQIDLSDF